MPQKTQVAKKATFSTDDKRAQYARLVAFNYGIRQGVIKKGSDVNSVSNADLQKALDELVEGNLLEGKAGIEYIQSLTKAGATDEKVAKRGLTTAYAMEVRPFLRRKTLSPEFGRRGRKAAAADGGERKSAAKKTPARKKSGRRAAKKSQAVPATAPEPESEPEPVEAEA